MPSQIKRFIRQIIKKDAKIARRKDRRDGKGKMANPRPKWERK